MLAACIPAKPGNAIPNAAFGKKEPNPCVLGSASVILAIGLKKSPKDSAASDGAITDAMPVLSLAS